MEEQDEDVQALRGKVFDRRTTEAAMFDDLLSDHLPSAVQGWTCDVRGWNFDIGDTLIEVSNEHEGSVTVTAASKVMPRKFLDAMRIGLRNTLHVSSDLEWTTFGFAVLLLQFVEEAVAWSRDWQEYNAQLALSIKGKKTNRMPRMSEFIDEEDWEEMGTEERNWYRARWNATQPQGFKAQEVAGWYSMVDNIAGLDLSSVEDTAKHLLGKTIAEICKDITHPKEHHGKVFNDNIRILHVEPVFRHDLIQKFLTRKYEIHQHLLQMSHQDLRKGVSRKIVPPYSRDDTIEGLSEVLAKPSVTFHGAPKHLIGSIVRYGFLVPGE